MGSARLCAGFSAHGNVSLYDVGKMFLAAVEQRLAMTWDPLHFFPFVYEQFNDVLLNNLCKNLQAAFN